MAERFCKCCSRLHDLDKPWPAICTKLEPDRRGPWRVHVISDTIELQGQHDGKIYTSKAKLRASYRANGMEEIGTDPARLRLPEPPRPDERRIRESIERATARVAAGERVSHA